MNPEGQLDAQRGDQKDDVQALFSRALFIRCDTLEVRSPVVILQNEKANCYHVLEKHFRPEYLAAQERFWRNVKHMYSPPLETWRPRVNGVQLKVLQGARLPENEEEWGALDAALRALGPYLRSDSSTARLFRELRDFMGLLDVWWANRKRGEGGPSSKRTLGPPGTLPISKRQSVEYVQPQGMVGPIFVQPEIISHSILGPSPLQHAPLIRSSALPEGAGGLLHLPVDPSDRQGSGHPALQGSGPLARHGSGQLPHPMAATAAMMAAGGRLMHGHHSYPQLLELLAGEAVVMAGERASPRPAMPAAAHPLPAQQQHAQQRAQLAGAEEEQQESSPLLPAGQLPALIAQSLDTNLIEDALRAGAPSFMAAGETDADDAGQQSHPQSPRPPSPLLRQSSQPQPLQRLPATFGSVQLLEDAGALQAERAQRQAAAAAAVVGPQGPPSPPLTAPAPHSPAAHGGAGAHHTVSEDLDKAFVALNVGGHRFLSTAATLAVVDGSFLWQLAQQCSGKDVRRGPAQAPEFFVDRSGKLFEYVLDYLRSERFGESESCLPRDERTLGLLRREAEFYQLPRLAERIAAAQAHATQQAAQRGGVERGSDSAVGGGSTLREGVGGGGAGAEGDEQGAGAMLDAVFLETGMQPAGSVGLAQAALLQQLNYTLQARQAQGYSIVKHDCGAEREGSMRNLYYHVVLRKQL